MQRGTRYPLTASHEWLPNELPNLQLWCRFNKGITVATGVSQWDDQSGNGNHLKQATAGNQPALQSDGSILFDGVDNFLKADAFTLNQPETIYILVNLVTETNGDFICDGNTSNVGGIRELAALPLAILAPTQVFGSNALPVYGSYSIISAVINGAASFINVNNGIGDGLSLGASNMAGFTLGAQGGGAGGWGNIQVKEVIVFSEAHDAQNRNQMIGYLARLGGLSV